MPQRRGERRSWWEERTTRLADDSTQVNYAAALSAFLYAVLDLNLNTCEDGIRDAVTQVTKLGVKKTQRHAED